MKFLKTSNNTDFKCICGRYLFSIKNNTLYIKCRRCKRIHKIKLPDKSRTIKAE